MADELGEARNILRAQILRLKQLNNIERARVCWKQKAIDQALKMERMDLVRDYCCEQSDVALEVIINDVIIQKAEETLL